MRVRTVVALGFIALISAATLLGCSGQQPSSAAGSPTSTPIASAEPTPTSTPESTPSASGALGGVVVRYQLDGAPASTEVNVVPDGPSVSGTAVTTFREGTHTVRLECASQNGDTWALGGKTEQTTVPGERAGDWSAVIVKNGSPQGISIWLSDDPSKASDCAAWLASIDFASIGPENFSPVESGTLVPPA